MMFGGNSWTKDEVALLIECWQQGMTASQIESRIFGKSRNAILGKLKRLRDNPVSHEGAAKKRSTGEPAPIKSAPAPRQQTRAYIREPLPPITPIVANGLGHAIDTAKAFSQAHSIPLIEAGPHHCRWPIDGEGQHRCCGSQVTRTPYCEEHARRAFN